MTKRLSQATKAARRQFRQYLHVFGGKRLAERERAAVVADFIRRAVMDIESAFPGELDSESIVAIGALLEAQSSAFAFEDLAVKLAELRERLYTGRSDRASAATTVH